jgi:hypothetical protein
MILASRPRKIILNNLIFILNLFLARPKSATGRSRLNSDSSTTSTRSKTGGSIPTRNAAPTSAGN